MAKKFTPIFVEKVKPDPAKRLEIPDALLSGLYLIVQPAGAKSWAVRYRHAGVPRKLTLGRYPLLSLMEARSKAREALQAVAEGRDPAAAKKAKDPSDPFRDVAAQFLERHVKQHCRPSYARETDRLLAKNVLPVWGDRPIRDIGRRDVLDLLES